MELVLREEKETKLGEKFKSSFGASYVSKYRYISISKDVQVYSVNVCL